MTKPHGLSLSKRTFSRYQLLVFVLIFAMVGAYLLFHSFASPNPNLPGDLNNDNIVNGQDLAFLASVWKTNNVNADINQDGTVDLTDLNTILFNWGDTYSGGSGSSWSWNAQTASLDPNSTALIAAFESYAVVNPNMVMNNYAVATADATASSPCYSVTLTDGGNIDPTVCIPLGTQPDPSSDGHLTVQDTIHGRETDFWQAVYNSGTQKISSASAGVSFALGSVNEASTGWGGDAANLPLRRGLIFPSEIQAGAINHPLVFSTPDIGSGSPRYPALHNTSTCGSSCANHLVEGSWLRLNPSVNCSGYSLPAWQATVCVALQKYGMFLRDGGGTLGIYGQNPINGGTTWPNVGLNGNSVSFSANFPWSQLQILSPPSG